MNQETVIKFEPVWIQEDGETPALHPVQDLGAVTLFEDVKAKPEPGVSTVKELFPEKDFKEEPGPSLLLSDPLSEEDTAQDPMQDLGALTILENVKAKPDPGVPTVKEVFPEKDFKEEPGRSLLLSDPFSEEDMAQDQPDMKDEITFEYHDIDPGRCTVEDSRLRITDKCEFGWTGSMQRCHLKAQVLSLTEDQKHICHICNKGFKQLTNLKLHLLIHTGERKFICDYCTKGFVTHSNLNTHLLTHTSVKEHKCHICSKVFTQRGSLKGHLVTHMGEGKHKCHICSMRYMHPNTLKRHLLTHTGVKEHVCSICSRNFMQRSTLNVHLVSHMGLGKHQ